MSVPPLPPPSDEVPQPLEDGKSIGDPPSEEPVETIPAAEPPPSQPDRAMPLPPINVMQAVGLLISMTLLQGGAWIFGRLLFHKVLEYDDWICFAFGLSSLVTAIFAYACMRNRYGSSAQRVLALHWPLRPLQTFLVVLLTYPLLLLCSEAANVASEGLGRNSTPVPGQLTPIKQFEQQHPPNIYEELDKLYEADMKLPLWLALLFTALLPAIGEELLFRGLIGRGFIGNYGVVRGILGTSLLFAVMHLDPVRMAATFVMGLGLHVVYLLTRSLPASMLLHGLYNALITINFKIATAYQFDVTFTNEAGRVPLTLLAASAFAVVAILLSLVRLRPRWIHPDGTVWATKIVSAERPSQELGVTARVNRLGLCHTLAMIAAFLTLATAVAFEAQESQNRQIASDAILKGNGYYDRLEYAAAIEAYSEAIARRPKDAAGYSNRGLALVGRGDFAAALPDFDRALELAPADAHALITRAGAYAGLGRGADALADFHKASRLKPELGKQRQEWSKFLRERASQATQNKEHDAAMKDIDTAIQLDATDPETYRVRGSIFHAQHRMELAIAEYTTALRLNPGDSFSQGNRGLCRLFLKEYDAAVADLNYAIREQPQASLFVWNRGRAYHFLSNLPLAKADYTKAIALDPMNATLRYDRGQAHFENRDYRDAIEDYLASVQLDPAFSEGHLALAVLYANSPDPTVRDGRRAVEHATKANELKQYSHAGDLEILAAACAEAADFAAAVRWQKKAILLLHDSTRQTNAELLLKEYERGRR